MSLPFNMLPVAISVEIARCRVLISQNGNWPIKDVDNPHGKGWVFLGTQIQSFQNMLLPGAQIAESTFIRWKSESGDVLPVPGQYPHSFPEEEKKKSPSPVGFSISETIPWL